MVVRATNPPLRFNVLGPLEITRSGKAVHLGSGRQRSLLGILLMRANEVVSADRLIQEIWGESVMSDRQNALWVNVSNLRKALEPDNDERADDGILQTRQPGYVLVVDNDQLDAGDFERLLAEGRALAEIDPAAASMVFSEALSLWRGHALEDFRYESWAQPAIHRLEELRMEAVEGRIDAEMRRGNARALVGELESLVRQHPTRERLTGQLMLALHRSGRRREAVRAFETLQGRLADELGVDPSAPLRRLHDRIVDGDLGLDTDDTRSLPGAGPEPGLSIRGYEVREQLGVRGSGTLYRGYQPSIGREVVIKVIRPELADDPRFIRRFEREAQAIARLEHPHIVPLYDYWREPGAAYLVMRYVHGETLRDRLSAGPLSTDALARMVDQVGAALEAAHDDGVVHGLVEPPHVLIDGSENFYLADFEIAQRSTDDVAALASTVTAAAVGRSGTVDELLDELDPRLAEVISRSVDPHADRSIGTVPEFRAALAGALRVGTASASSSVGENPYKGLHSFQQSDDRDFFGREQFVQRLIERLSRNGAAGRFVAVVGPSGCGKSSVVKAGVIPALRRGAVTGADEWFIAEMTPERHPFEQLEAALLGVAVHPPASLLELLAMDRGLCPAVRQALPGEDAQLLLVIDQFEELFTQTDPETARRFMDELVAALRDDRGCLRLVVTLRADFYDRPLRHRGFSELLRVATEVVTPMTAEELTLAISGPAERVGVRCEPSLVGEMVAAAVDRTSALPLFQYALTEVFDHRDGDEMTAAGYRSAGGLAGPLVDRAEALFHGLGTEEQAVARRVFLHLVTLVAGRGDTRRRVLLSDLALLNHSAQRSRYVIDTFGRHRLLAFDRDPVSREPTVEISHEALLTTWPRLERWIDEAASDLRAERRLADAAEEWQRRDRHHDYLMTGARLARFEGWMESPPVGVTASERDFLEASAKRAADLEGELARRRRRDELFRRRSRILVGLAALTVVIGALGAFALVEQRRASDLAQQISRDESARQLAFESQLSADSDPELALMLAVEAARRTASSGEVLPEAVDALHRAVQAARIQYPLESAPVAVRPAAGGGVFLMEPDDLIDLAQANITRRFTDAECAGGQLDPCGDPGLPLPTGLAVTGGPEAYAGPADAQPLAGTRVRLVTSESNDDLAALRASFSDFADRTGIDVIVRTTRSDELPIDVAEQPEGTDIVVIPQPGVVPALAGRRAMDVSTYLDVDSLEQAWGPYLTSFITMGDDGTWPSDEGGLYGVWAKLDAKSLIWFSADEPATIGDDLPSTWEGWIALSDEMVAEGDHPWCFGLNSGPSTGWPATDLVESMVLRSEGPDVYDAWLAHEIPFDDPAILAAAERVGHLIFTPGYMDTTPAVAVQRWFGDPIFQLASDSPTCSFTSLGSYAPALGDVGQPGERIDFVEFPVITAEHGETMLGGGTFAAVLSDRPEVRAVVEFIASPSFGTGYSQAGIGWIPPNTGFDVGAFSNRSQREMVELTHAALRADGFRFDASDLMPPEVGAGTFWGGMVRWFRSGPDELPAIMAEIEAGWPSTEP